jgi:colicin import membrane protein
MNKVSIECVESELDVPNGYVRAKIYARITAPNGKKRGEAVMGRLSRMCREGAIPSVKVCRSGSDPGRAPLFVKRAEADAAVAQWDADVAAKAEREAQRAAKAERAAERAAARQAGREERAAKAPAPALPAGLADALREAVASPALADALASLAAAVELLREQVAANTAALADLSAAVELQAEAKAGPPAPPTLHPWAGRNGSH